MTVAPVRPASATAGLALHRLEQLLDGSRVVDEVSGVVVAEGDVDGVAVLAFATDPSVQGGALGSEGCGAIARWTDEAVRRGCPVIGLWHSGGARLREGVAGLDAVARVFSAQTRASGRVPQLSVVLGPAAGGAAYGPALTDLVVLGPQGRVFVTGPDVVRRVTGEDCDMTRLGGPEVHGRRSGVVHLVAETDEDALLRTRELVVLLGAQGSVGTLAPRPDPSEVMPEQARRAYDVRPLVDRLLDGPGLELQPGWAPNVVTALGRLGGLTVGVVANNPLRLGGCLDSASGEKAARFVNLCDALGVPLLFVVDVPGYLPGLAQEWDGVVRRGAKLLHAYAACRVPRLTVVTHKSFGGAFIAMGSKGLGADAVYAWPRAQVDVMGASAAVEVLHRRVLAELDGIEREAEVLRLADQHLTETGGLQRAVACGAVDRVIAPADTRRVLAADLARLTGGITRGDRKNTPL
jgi:acetyl-CoA/propionyl-CoA carboxylase carboxyl transferase subunit